MKKEMLLLADWDEHGYAEIDGDGKLWIWYKDESVSLNKRQTNEIISSVVRNLLDYFENHAKEDPNELVSPARVVEIIKERVVTLK